MFLLPFFNLFAVSFAQTTVEEYDTWSFISCYTDGVDGAPRTLSQQITFQGSLTVESCLGLCTIGAFTYCGVEYGDECWADNVINSAGSPAAITDCDFSCSGNADEFCGAGNRLDLYSTTAPEQATNEWEIEIYTSDDCSGTPITTLTEIGICSEAYAGASVYISAAPTPPADSTGYLLNMFFYSEDCVASSTPGSFEQTGIVDAIGCTESKYLPGLIYSVSVSQSTVLGG